MATLQSEWYFGHHLRHKRKTHETTFFQRTGEQVQVLPDGSFLIVGNSLTTSNFSTTSSMAVTKFNQDGSLATSFGTLGALQIPWQFVFSGDFSSSSISFHG